VPVCALFAAAVEFGQLWFPNRTCSGTDILAQSAGALCGVLAWVLAGPGISDRLGKLLHGGAHAGRGTKFLAGFAAFLLFVQWLPLDFSISPYDIWRWMKRDYLKVSYVPFEELRSPAWRHGATVWDKVQSWLELALLFLPLGLHVPGARLRKRWIVPVAFAFAFLSELGQVTVSRHPSSADVLVAFAAILAGWGIASALATPWMGRHRADAALVLAQVWLIAMILIHWQPFKWLANPLEFPPEAWRSWPAGSLDKILTKFVLFAPVGMLAAWAGHGLPPRRLQWEAALLGGLAALALEVGQSTVAGRTGSPADVFIGLLGGWLGAALALQAGTPQGGRDA
jgi:VanZ family protein